MPWLVSGARFTVFIAADANVSRQLWRELVGEEPEHSSVERTISTTVDIGPFGEGLLRLQTQPMRLDWNYDASDVGTRGPAMPHFGTFPPSADPFLDLMNKWISGLDFPSTTRVALGFLLTQPTATRETGYVELEKYIDGVPSSRDSTEFQYQINRPRASQAVPGMLINRLSRWSVANYISFAFDPTAQQQLIPSSKLHVRLELDISTPAGRTNTIPADQVQILVADLLTGAIEISEKGNHL